MHIYLFILPQGPTFLVALCSPSTSAERTCDSLTEPNKTLVRRTPSSGVYEKALKVY